MPDCGVATSKGVPSQSGVLVTPKDRLALLDIIDLTDKIVVEIGVLKGAFSDEIIKRSPEHLYLVDPWCEQEPEKYVDIQNVDQKKLGELYESVAEHFNGADDVTIFRMFSHDAAREFEGAQVDVVYIDGNHSFYNAFHDLCAWAPKIKPGGWLCGHDFGNPAAFPGVRMAVDAFCRVTGNQIACITQERYSSFAIQFK